MAPLASIAVLVLLITSTTGRVSIPTCCHVENSNKSNFHFKCSGRDGRSTDTSRLPRTIPWTVVQRLGLVNESQWVEKDVKCRHSSSLKPIFDDLPRGGSDSALLSYEFNSEGYMTIRNGSENAKYLHVDQYCINEISDPKIVLKYCEATCIGTEPCIRLCCPLGTVLQLIPGKISPCVPRKWNPVLYRNVADNTTAFTNDELRALQPRYFYRSIQYLQQVCEKGRIHPVINEDLVSELGGRFEYFNFRLDTHGSPQFRNQFRKWEQLVDSQHCISGMDLPESTVKSSTATIVFTCAPEIKEMVELQSSGLYGSLALFSSNFALITAISYALLFDKQNVHGWTLMSHSVAVFFCFIFLGIAHITKEDDEFRVTQACTVVATLTHYFFLANFTWLLLLSVDLWLTFKSISAPLARGGRGIRRFCVYSMFGWTLPAIVVVISWTLEIKFRYNEDSTVPVPLYGELFCYVARHALWEFVYGPTAILIILNFVLFCWTSVTLYRFQQQTKFATQQMNQERQSFVLFVKLFLVCGVLWLTELLSFTFSGAHITWYIQIFDSVNILQPVAIFIIFVFKWEVVNAIHEKYVILRPIIFPARFILNKHRQRAKNEVPVHHSKEDTHVSNVSTMERTTAF